MSVSMAATEITIFGGRFGSGKTEAAINYALSLVQGARAAGEAVRSKAAGLDVVLIDLDIVTPYFRSRETADALRQQGVEVIAPSIIGQHLDTPAITPQILGAIQQPDRPTVLDVGGDKQGARALGQFSAAIRQRGYVMHFVVNPFRPFTDTLEGLAGSISEIEDSARLKVTSLVSNPNLMSETSPDLLLRGHTLVEGFARELGLRIAFVCVERRWATRVVSQSSSSHFAGRAGPEKGQRADRSAASLQRDQSGRSADIEFAQPVLVLDRHFVMTWE
jgi:hypothetical protein